MRKLITPLLIILMVGLFLVLLSSDAIYKQNNLLSPNNGIQAHWIIQDVPMLPSASTDDQNGELISQIIAAELALSQRQFQISMQKYLDLAKKYQNPDLAKRALQVSVTLGAIPTAILAAEIWAQAEPENMEAQRITADLYIKSQQSAKSQPFLERILLSEEPRSALDLLSITTQSSSVQQKQQLQKLLKNLQIKYPNNPKLLLSISTLHLQLQQFNQAESAIEKTLALKPHWLLALKIKTQILIAQNKTVSALGMLKQEVNTHPNNFELRLFYAKILQKQRQLSQAEQQYQWLLNKTAYQGKALIGLAQIAILQQNLTSAIDYLRLALTHPEVNQDARFLLARLADVQQEYVAAINWYESINQGPFETAAKLRVAEIYVLLGQITAAQLALRSVPIKTLKDYKQLHLMEAELLYQANKTQAAINVLNRALSAIPNDIDILFARSMLAVKINRLDLMEQDLKQILLKQPQNIPALNSLGFILADKTKRYDEALVYISQALRLAPNNPEILDSMGWVQYRLGNLQESLKYLRQAQSLNPHDSEIAIHLGEVLWVSGEPQQALKIWRDALNKDPDNEELQNIILEFKGE